MARENWDPEMLRFTEMMEARAAAQPPVKLELPLDNSRELNDGLSLPLAKGGAVMAESEDRWLALRGRRILCRFHRPTAGTGHPVLVYLHGGGWVWGSVDTHDRLMREYAAASGCAVIGVDYALSPEAIFPQALEECAPSRAGLPIGARNGAWIPAASSLVAIPRVAIWPSAQRFCCERLILP